MEIPTQARKLDPWTLPASLARPVARGWLSADGAAAALMVAALRQPGPGADVVGTFRTLHFLLGQHVEREDVRRGIVVHRIGRLLRPLLARRAAWVELVDQALAVNRDADAPLGEDEVIAAVREAVFWALPRAPGRVRRGG